MLLFIKSKYQIKEKQLLRPSFSCNDDYTSVLPSV